MRKGFQHTAHLPSRCAPGDWEPVVRGVAHCLPQIRHQHAFLDTQRDIISLPRQGRQFSEHAHATESTPFCTPMQCFATAHMVRTPCKGRVMQAVPIQEAGGCVPAA